MKVNESQKFIFFSIILVFTIFFGIFQAETVKAASRYDNMYKAELVGELKEIELMPFQQKTIELKFKNIGTETWTNSGKKYSSIYVDPSTRTSIFSYFAWFGIGQPAMLVEENVKNGEIGTFILPLQAPGDLGDYKEKFKFAIEDVAWVNGSNITIPIKVTKSPKIADAGEGLSANILLKSHEKISAVGGSRVELRLGVKNTGPRTWKNIKVIEPGIALAEDNLISMFHDSSWPDGRVALALNNEEYKTGQLALIGIPFRVPRNVGEYKLHLQIISEGENIGGGLIELPVFVTSPSEEEINSEPLPVIEDWRGKEEPRFRAGISNIADAAIVSVNSAYNVVDGNGEFYTTLEPNSRIEWFYDSKTDEQLITINGALIKTKSYFRLEPSDPLSGVVTIDSLDRRANWNSSINYNEYRQVVEMRKNALGFLWLVNELPLEFYLKGLAEASNPWHIEFHKAQAVAARTYAMYYFERGGKHQNSGSSYILNSSSYDQVYKGYVSEKLNTNVAQAVEATRGQVIRYNNKIAMTPYFARSNGKTKTWSQVWGGADKPYLVSRDCKYDKKKGNKEWGHGVGMPQTDAAMRAEDGYNYNEILNAYYTEISVDRVYE